MKPRKAAQAINKLQPQERLEISKVCMAVGLRYFAERKIAAADLFFALTALIGNVAKAEVLSDDILNAEFLYE